MNIQRFTAPTSREALAKARAVFGEGTLILANRATSTGVEVMATSEDGLGKLDLGGFVVNFGRTEHQGSQFVELTVVSNNGRFVR